MRRVLAGKLYVGHSECVFQDHQALYANRASHHGRVVRAERCIRLGGAGGLLFLLRQKERLIVISLSIRRMPYTIRSSTAIIGQISPSIEEASISLGASQIKTFLRITIPMMLPGVLSGAIMSWITLISELSSSVILYTSKTMTLTVAIYSEVIRSNFGNAAAYSTILTLTSILSLLIFFRVSGSRDLSI